MPSKRKRSKAVPLNVTEIANLARSNPYVQRLIEDPKLRKNVATALASSRKAYARVSNGKVPVRALLEDKKLHSELGRALGAARDVTITLSYAQRRRRRRRLTFGRTVLIAGIASGVALATSEKLRSKLLDLLFGKEEEFQYTPPASSTAPSAPSTTVGAA
jgi:hypothetical protein